MMKKLFVVVACLVLHCAALPNTEGDSCSQAVLDNESLYFEQDPQNVTVNIGDTDVYLLCGYSTPKLVTWQYLQPTGWSSIVSSLGGLLGPVPDTELDTVQGYGSGISLLNVTEEVPRRFRCTVTEGINCFVVSEICVISIASLPKVEIVDSTVCTNSGDSAEISVSVTGTPVPDLALYRVGDGNTGQRRLTAEEQSRWKLSPGLLTLDPVVEGDAGSYKLVANNSKGSVNKAFTVVVSDPTSVGVSVSQSEVLAEYGTAVSVDCLATKPCNPMLEYSIQWKDPEGNVVTKDTSGSVYVTESQDTSTLFISSLGKGLEGQYTCNVSSAASQYNYGATATIYGPPEFTSSPSIDVLSNGMVNVSWEAPDTAVPISKYVIYYSLQQDQTRGEKSKTVPGGETSCLLSPSDPGVYLLYVRATGSFGESEVEGTASTTETFTIAPPSTTTPTTDGVGSTGSLGGDTNAIIVGVVLSALLVLLVGGALVLLLVAFYRSYHKRNSSQQTWTEEVVPDQRQATLPSYTSITLPPPYDLPLSPDSTISLQYSKQDMDPKWEFPRENIQFSEVLCEGITTILYKGKATGLKGGKSMEVSIKACKEDATEDDVKAFIYEMELLLSIGPHPNIMPLIQICTTGTGPAYMVMDYMCNGDLLGFLRASRGHHNMYTVSPGIRNQPPNITLTSKDLLNIATKTASGMKYLADRKIVHRALSARNVLLGSNMDVKIYNVGAFDVDRDSMLKWMAPETLFDGTATTNSDVWSFGVTLWELVTVGGTPYAEILAEDLFAQLHGGMRMPKPPHCAQEVYDIMDACWDRNPMDRPTFAAIYERLECLSAAKLSYLDLRTYDNVEYSQFENEDLRLSTAL